MTFKPEKTIQAMITVAPKKSLCASLHLLDVSSANVEGAQCRANLILLPHITLVYISKNVYIFLTLYSSGI